MYDYTPYTHCESVTPRHCVFDWGIRQPTEAESDSGTRTQDTEAQPEQVAEAIHSVEGEQQAAVPPVNLGQPKCPEGHEAQPEQVAEATQSVEGEQQGPVPPDLGPPKCPEGHGLTPWVPFESEASGFPCSDCERVFPAGTRLYGCLDCEYDLCPECFCLASLIANPFVLPATFEVVDNNTNSGPGWDLNPVRHFGLKWLSVKISFFLSIYL